jgi:hypothetical protein
MGKSNRYVSKDSCRVSETFEWKIQESFYICSLCKEPSSLGVDFERLDPMAGASCNIANRANQAATPIEERPA